MCCDFGDSPQAPAPPPDALSALLEGRLVGQDDEIRRAVLLLRLTGRLSPGPRPGLWVISGVPNLEEPKPLPSLDERVLEALREHPGGLTCSRVEDMVGGRRSLVGFALRRLRATGQASSSRRKGWLTWTPGAPIPEDERARLAMETKLLARLGRHPEGLTGRQVEALVGGNARILRATLKGLFAAGRVTADPKAGRGGGTIWKIA